MEKDNQPLVSIGVPVFNGEKGLARALDSLIEQDYLHLEIIISDNASTDSTPEICAKYVQKDPRIKYSRSTENRGAPWNLKQLFELSSGKYFMWAAHDDMRELSFVSSCVEKMEQCPEAVVCQTHSALFIEGRKERLCTIRQDSHEGITGLVNRYREALRNPPTTASYGLYRSSVLRKTRIWITKNIIAADLVFYQELSIFGDFVQVPKVLFHYFRREKWNTIDQDYFTWFGKEKKPWWYLPFVVVFCNQWKLIACVTIPFRLKLYLWWVLIGHEAGQVALKVLIKVSGLLCPERWKEKLGCAIYWRWLHSPNVKVDCADLYFERIIKPRLGWWRYAEP